MREHTKPRRSFAVSPAVLRALRPAFRLCRERDAYVLRGIGRFWGPMLVIGPPRVRSAAAAAATAAAATAEARRGAGMPTSEPAATVRPPRTATTTVTKIDGPVTIRPRRGFLG